MKILVTGFDPFGGESVNPAFEVIKALPEKVNGADIVKLEVPTVFGKSIDTVVKKIDQIVPDAVLCIGQAGGRFGVTPERVAINVDDARIKDNEGNQPLNRVIREDGDKAYFATLPIKRMAQAVLDAGIPAQVSNTAGTFVCNHLMYGVLYHVAKKNYNTAAGFVHIPYLLEQITDKPNTPGFSKETLVKAVEALLGVIAEGGKDADLPMGATH